MKEREENDVICDKRQSGVSSKFQFNNCGFRMSVWTYESNMYIICIYVYMYMAAAWLSEMYAQ